MYLYCLSNCLLQGRHNTIGLIWMCIRKLDGSHVTADLRLLQLSIPVVHLPMSIWVGAHLPILVNAEDEEQGGEQPI